MKIILRFKTKDIRKLIEHCRKSKKHGAAYGQGNGPALWLVHDEGIYLMSNGIPAMPRANRVVYAQWFGPERHVPGDDYCESLPLATCEKWLIGDDVVITMTGKSMMIDVFKKPAQRIA
jgi:hypothetical protein